MKKLITIFILTLNIFLFSCKKDAIISNYDKSYAAWLNFKSSSHNSYTYVAYSASVFGGYSETKFSVQNGTIVMREFLSGYYKPNTKDLIIINSWVENSSSLNTHGNEGNELLTLDQVYDKAKTVWLKADSKQNDVYFESKNNDLISSAGYVPKGCQDDCFNGIKIKNISAL
ncbi:MAG: hypothetical protein EOP43_07900 [Sphingobacteriaceae bacterium]|nr:MAG: hypothetical protein EOP43_07900 [Sphingobacteriaceae bacterium]